MGRASRGGTVGAALIVAVLLGACTGQVTESPAEGGTATVSLPTCQGAEEFTTPKTRVAVTEGGLLDTFAALGVADRVVARSGGATSPDPAHETLFAGAADLGPSAPSTEGLLGVSPDLVVEAVGWHLDPAQGGADPRAVRASGAQIYPTRAACSTGMDRAPDDTLDGVLADINHIGALMGVPERATALTEELRAGRDDIAARVAGRARVRGVQIGISGGELFATGTGLPAEMLDVAGMDNLFADQTQVYVPVSPEVITALNPQAISIFAFPTDDIAAQREYLRRTFPDTEAVRTGRISVVESRKAGTSPAVFEGVAELAHFLHPQVVGPAG